MTLNDMQGVLRQLEVLAGGWTAGIPPIERDLALDKLRMLYEALRLSGFAAPAAEEPSEPLTINLDEVLSVGISEPEAAPVAETSESEPEADVQPEPVVSSIPASAQAVSEPAAPSEAEPEVADGPETGSLPAVAAEAETEAVVSEPFAVVETEVAAEPEPGSRLVAAEESDAEPEPPAPSVPKPEQPETRRQRPEPVPTLFGMDEPEELLRHRQKQRVLMSLYDMDEPAVEPNKEPQPAFEEERSAAVRKRTPAPEPEDDEMVIEEIDIDAESEYAEETSARPSEGPVLGDVINHDVQTLADVLAASHRDEPEVSGHGAATALREMIGLNDRFLMIRDLFGGDAEEYDRTIGVLDEFGDLDDCMIYIAENYAWNPNSDGAKLLMELIQRKLA